MIAEADEATLSFYAGEAPMYAARSAQLENRQLDAFLAALAPGARILELGCGGGRDSEAMIARGFDVEPTDGVPEMAQQAEKRLGRPVRVLRFDELDAIAQYDAIWAHACLLHVPRGGLPKTLFRIWRALKPGGLHFASFKGGTGDGRDRFGRYFNYLTSDEVADAYRRSAPWTKPSIEETLGSDYDGVETRWIAVTVRRSSSGSEIEAERAA